MAQSQRKSSRSQSKLVAENIGARIRTAMGNTAVSDFAERIGVSRSWLHDILSSRGGREPSIATMSSIADSTGYSLEWLVTGTGMPGKRWEEETVLIPRLILDETTDELRKSDTDLVLMARAALKALRVKEESLGVFAVESNHLAPHVGKNDEVLVDLSDRVPVAGGIFLLFLKTSGLQLAMRGKGNDWVVKLGTSLTLKSPQIAGRVRFIWKRL